MDLSILREIRKTKKLKQYEVAKTVGISQEYLSLIERNERSPSVENLENICNKLDLELRIIIKT